MIWLILVFIVLFFIIGISASYNDSIEEHTSDAMNNLAALALIDDLKYNCPSVWANCASKILGRSVEPPTPEQCLEWKLKNRKK